MTPRQQVFSISVCLVLLAAIIWLVRQRRLSEYHSGLWLLSGAGLLTMVLWYGALEFLAELAGAVVVTTAVFVIAFLFLVAVSIHTSCEMTRLDRRVRLLTQEIALLEARLAKRQAAPPPGIASVGDANAGPDEDVATEGIV
jgi:hypothetical protein